MHRSFIYTYASDIPGRLLNSNLPADSNDRPFGYIRIHGKCFTSVSQAGFLEFLDWNTSTYPDKNMMSEISEREYEEWKALMKPNPGIGTQRPEDIAIIDHQSLNIQNMMSEISEREYEEWKAMMKPNPGIGTQRPEDIAIIDHQSLNV